MYSLDKDFYGCIGKSVKAGFWAGDVKIQKAVRVLFIPLLIKDFEGEGLQEDTVAALINKIYLVERTEHVRKRRLNLDRCNRSNYIEVLNSALRTVKARRAIHAFTQFIKIR